MSRSWMCRDGIQNGVRKPALGFGLVRFGHFTIRSRKDVEADGREETEEENREAGGIQITKKMVASKPEREREREREGGGEGIPWEREKRDGETARILFAIKARDNLKAITITHGLRVHTLSPSTLAFRDRAEDSLMVSVCPFPSTFALFADRFA